MSGLFASPSSTTMASTEAQPLAIDFTALVQQGDTLTSPASQLVKPDGSTVALADSPTISGNLVQQIIRSGVLIGGETYRLDLTVSFNASKRLTESLLIICPY